MTGSAAPRNETSSWDPKYEWKAVLLLSLGFGLVCVERFMIMPLFPAIKEEFDLSYTALGLITGALALAWGVSALLMGNLSDRMGHRKVIIVSIIVFSVLVGASGLATGLGGLILVRVLMGFADGAYTPVSISATVEASKPTRHGFNVGLQQMMAPLLGLAITPLVITQLLQVMDWRWIFLLLAFPGFILAAAMYFVLRDVRPVSSERSTVNFKALVANWSEALSHRNPKFLIVCMLCWLTCLIVTTALLPSYLTEHLRLGITDMGYILSAIGFGAAAGCLVVPATSDRVGRKPAMAVSAAGALIFVLLFTQVDASPSLLFWCLFMTHFFNFGLITLTVGPVSAESVPPHLMATSSGLVIGFGEIFGGAGAPVFAGFMAEHYGLESVFYVAMAGLAVGFLAILMLEETAPRAARASRQTPADIEKGAA